MQRYAKNMNNKNFWQTFLLQNLNTIKFLPVHHLLHIFGGKIKVMEKQATWIWYPGDFEVWLGNRFNNRRTERGAMFPPFWKQDSHWTTVAFTKDVSLDEDEVISIAVEGQYNFSIDGKLQSPHCNRIPKGRHQICFKVWHQATPPALFVEGKSVHTDSTWKVTYEDKIWIDENGVAHGSGIYVPVGHGFDSPLTPPSQFRLQSLEASPTTGQVQSLEASPTTGRMQSLEASPTTELMQSLEASPTKGVLYDFGRETFGYLRLKGLRGTVRVYYGESREEALDTEHCETLDILTDGEEPFSKAFRYVYIVKEDGASYGDVSMLYEYAPVDMEKSGSFRCSDEELNRIWDVSAYTLELTTREFFCDGIKRDRWVWSGDAIQSYLMNYYLHFDSECVKRTIRQLRGKDPVTSHVNTIMDYTFYWFKSIADYYDYTADLDFVREMWPKMVTLMDYVLSRSNADGLAEGKPDDWIFVDWVDFPMPKHGILAFEQILYWKALTTMEDMGRLLGHDDDAGKYAALAKRVRDVTDRSLYSFGKEAYIHALENISTELTEGRRYREDNLVTKFPNMFAIIYDFCSNETKAKILKSVLLNPDVPAITTPYMRFYELEALCQMGLQERVLPEMKAYWGGMLREGATTFWEKYNPEEKGAEHLAMYGRPYGKSLCHAWGASPLYIIGRYFLGVSPVKPGYEEYEVRPVLAGLEWMEGEVPTPFGKIHVKMDKGSVTVRSDGGQGTLIVGDKSIAIPADEAVKLD